MTQPKDLLSNTDSLTINGSIISISNKNKNYELYLSTGIKILFRFEGMMSAEYEIKSSKIDTTKCLSISIEKTFTGNYEITLTSGSRDCSIFGSNVKVLMKNK